MTARPSTKESSHPREVEKLLVLIKNALKTMKASSVKSLDQVLADSKKAEIMIPFAALPKSKERRGHLQFAFAAPENVSIVGSYLLGSQIASANIDVAVQMPATLFREKDHLNYRYFYKRAYYIFMVAKTLRKVDGLSSLQFEYSKLHGSSLKPILVIKVPLVTDSHTSNMDIRIIPSVASSVFGINRLSPGRNSIRFASYQDIEERQLPLDFEPIESPTPFYNNLVLADMFYDANLSALHQIAQSTACFVDALKLGKAWLRSNSLDQGPNAFSGFMWSMLLAYVIQQGLAEKQMSDLQLFRCALLFLSRMDATKPLFFNHETLDGFGEDDFQGRPALVDSSGASNVFFALDLGCLNKVSMIAELTLLALSENPGLMEDFFSRTPNMVLQYDEILSVNAKEIDSTKIVAELVNCFDSSFAMINSLAPILRRAIGDRARLVSLYSHSVPCTPLAEWKIVEDTEQKIGLVFNPESCFRLADLGPLADDTVNAKEFREFWAGKAELRRFKDGSIRESLVWATLPAERHLVMMRLISYTLSQHLGLPRDALYSTAGLFDFALGASRLNDLPFSAAISVFEELSCVLRGLRDMPLSIVQCTPSSANLRYTELYPTKPISSMGFEGENLPPFMPVHEVLLHFESSGKWPEDLAAVRAAKQAFYAHLQRRLLSEFGIYSALTRDFIDVLKDGFVFRCQIICEQERRLLLAKGGLAVEEYDAKFIRAPQHASLIHSFSTKHVMFGPTVRLVKRWLACQLLLLHFPEEVVELVVASLFTEGGNYVAPHTAFAGFLRFLEAMASFNWRQKAILIDPMNLISLVERKQIRDRRSQHPNVHAFIVTPFDRESKSTFAKPTTTALVRCKHLARISLQHILEKVEMRIRDGLEVIFRPPLSDFDALLNLDPHSISRGDWAFEGAIRAAQDRRSAKLEKTTRSCTNPAFLSHLPGFDSVKSLLEELQAKFGERVEFFADLYGGTTVGIRWLRQIEDISGETPKKKRKIVQNTMQSSDEMITAMRIHANGMIMD